MMLLFNTSKVHMSITLVNKTNSIDIEFYINDNKELFDKLYSISEKIQDELSFTMGWQSLDSKKTSGIPTILDDQILIIMKIMMNQ